MFVGLVFACGQQFRLTRILTRTELKGNKTLEKTRDTVTMIALERRTFKKIGSKVHLSVHVAITRVTQTRVLGQMSLYIQNFLASLIRFHLSQMHGRVQRTKFSEAVATDIRAKATRMDGK